jgi:carboxypeptidase T
LLIPLSDKNLMMVSSFGIEIIHSGSEDHFIVEIAEAGQKILDEAGIDYHVAISDLTGFYRKRNEGVSHHAVLKEYRNNKNYNIPENFSLGSMGGFCTYSEMLEHMDNMAGLFPELISPKDSLPGLTIQNRPVYWQRISSNPQTKQNKPAVFYNGLIHAREPASMQQLIFFMYYLLENYALDDEIKKLVDNTELYFVPCTNPDGYLYNEMIAPDGGGLWRKNRRLNYNGTYGVDLNRNFGYMWGHDDFGSSPNPASNTYRGEAPFSEPETQMLREFSINHNFKIVLNYHSYSDLLLHPFGYAGNVPPDYDYIRKTCAMLTEQNGYTIGTAQRLLYLTNGDATDWYYGEQNEKPKMISFTPEVGTEADGFWPAIERIIPLCQQNLHLNILAAQLAGSYAEIFDDDEVNITQKEGYLKFGVIRYGLTDEPVFCTIQPISNNILDMETDRLFESLPLMDFVRDSVYFFLNSAIIPGERVKLVIHLHNDFFSFSDTIVKIFGTAEQLYFDLCDNLDNWNVFSWYLNSDTYLSPPSSIGHHNGSFYPNNAQSTIYSKTPVVITQTGDLWVSFNATWDLDGGNDYVTFVVSKNNGASWIPYQGIYSQNAFLNGQIIPVYESASQGWVNEKILITDVAGDQVKFGFRFQSDNKIGRAGFFFDDFDILTANTQTQFHQILVQPGWSGISSFIAPVNSNIQQLFGGHINVLLFLTDKHTFFQPGNPNSTLANWNSEHGYMVKTAESFTLIIDGYPEKSVPIDLSQGYNLIPVLTFSEVPVEDLETIPPNTIQFIKDACGVEVYWPLKEIFSLKKLVPGMSYYIYLSEDAQLFMK